MRTSPGQVAFEAPLPGGGGFWEVYPDGQVVAQGNAQFYGDMAGVPLNKPIVGMAATPNGDGYWLVAADGGIFSFGDANFYGSTGAMTLNKPIVGMAATPSGNGYWLVAADGGIFSFGDANFYGSTGAMTLNKPIVGMAATPSGNGYWLVAADGGIFSFGDANFYGSTGAMTLNKPIVGMATTPNGNGYWLVAADGGIFSFGDAGFYGSAVGQMGATQAVGVVASGGGYYVLTASGQLYAFGAATRISTTQALPADQNPSSSISPSSAFESACFGGGSSAACDSAALADIDQARAGEGLGPMILPANFATLSTEAQVVVVANSERAARGLPAMADNAQLDVMAAAGAQAGADPTGPSGYSWGSNISWGYPTALAADFAWMYDDGPGGTNASCTATDTSGCWGHRDNILSDWNGQMGAGVYDRNGTLQLTELFVQNF